MATASSPLAPPLQIRTVMSPKSVLDGTRADIFARVTRAPGHFGIITQELRFQTGQARWTGTMKNSTVIVPVHRACPICRPMGRHDDSTVFHRACPVCEMCPNKTSSSHYNVRPVFIVKSEFLGYNVHNIYPSMYPHRPLSLSFSLSVFERERR